MNELIEKIGNCVERGKVNKTSPYPANMKGLDGADELTREAIAASVGANDILQACNDAMQRIGAKFGRNEVFVPELLMAAKAMHAVMAHLKPFFQSGNLKAKGTFIIGTVSGDLHDIGKNLVSMVVEGNGWKVVDLGVDVKPMKFVDKIKEFPGCIVGLSALLTTTMASMSKTLQEIRTQFPTINIIVGGAPLSMDSAKEMGASGYARDPQGAVEWLNGIAQ
jgi:methanogenic corrinoid protein MtbC1